MKKILIANNNLQIGGIQRALINLLSEIAPEYEISLFLLAPEGPLMKELPAGVRVISGNPFVRVLGLSQEEAEREGIFPMLWRAVLVALTRLFRTRFVFPLLSCLQRIPGKYDLAISYMQNGSETCFYGGCAELVLHSADAKKKVCFLHCDFENYEGRCDYNIKTLMKFDAVAAVSDSVAERLLHVVPQLRNRVVTVHNCQNSQQILSLSKAYQAPYTEGTINLFSAARLRREKGIARMVPIFGKIRSMGIDFVWRIAGDGEDRCLVEMLIERYDLQERVFLLGNLVNPYPHLLAADALLVPSYDEAAPMVFGEAQILGTPIITTDTASAEELVGKPNQGRVLANDDKRLVHELAELLMNFHKLKFDRKPLDNRLAKAEFSRL